jgi:hypothetical protein
LPKGSLKVADLLLFYWFQQVRTLAIASFFGFCGACVIYSLGSSLYEVSLGAIAVVYGFAWPRVLATPMLNFHWMATLPLSRLSLMFTRLGITIAGLCTLGFFYGLTYGIFSLTMPRPTISKKAVEAAAKLMSGVSVDESPISLSVAFGENPVYVVTLAFIVLGLSLIAISSSSVMVGQPNKSPRLSGNPWYHAVLKFRILNWAILFGGPLLIACLTPLAKSGGKFATLNFLLAAAWLVYVLGVYSSLNARIPGQGTKRWLVWLGAGHAVLACLAIWAAR